MIIAAGASMDDETGLTKVKKDTTMLALHLRAYGQLRKVGIKREIWLTTYCLGFWGSFGPSQSTIMVSSSESFIMVGDVEAIGSGSFVFGDMAEEDTKWKMRYSSPAFYSVEVCDQHRTVKI